MKSMNKNTSGKNPKQTAPLVFRPTPEFEKQVREVSRRNGQTISWLIKESIRLGWPKVQARIMERLR